MSRRLAGATLARRPSGEGQGTAELHAMEAGASTNARMLEVERAQMSAEAQARLADIRRELGLADLGRPTEVAER